MSSGKTVEADEEVSFQVKTEWLRMGDNKDASEWTFGRVKSRARRL